MKQLTFLFFAVLQSMLYSQNSFNDTNLTVTRDDLLINTFPEDSTANALVIYEYGNSFVDDRSFNLVTEIKRKIKILTKDGLDYANIEIPIYVGGDKEKITDIKGTTFNLENNETQSFQLSEKQIFIENYNKNFDIVKFLLPGVKEGSVITYSYTKTSPFFSKYHSWNFQREIPKLYSEYNTSIPGMYEYHIKLIGNKPLDINEQSIDKGCIVVSGAAANCAVSKYAMKNIPAFIPEEYMTTEDNYLSRVEYELKTIRYFDGRIKQFTQTWEDADKQLRSDRTLGAQLTKAFKYKVVVPEQVTNIENLEEKAQVIFNFIQNNFVWNNINRSFGENVDDLISKRSGTATEINMLLHNVLKSHDFDVHPMLISTRENGFPTKLFPVISEFNYMIVLLKLNDENYLLDASDTYLAFGEIPYKCLNQYGRVLNLKYGSYWFDIVPKKPSTIQIKSNLEFQSEDVLTGSFNTTSTGYFALPLKKSYYSNTTQYVENLDNKTTSINFDNHKVINPEKSSFDFIEEANISWNLDAAGNGIYLNPMVKRLYESNPFKLQDRTYPIDFGFKQAFLYSLKINLNGFYTVKEKPDDLNFNLPNNKGTIMFKTEYNDDELNLYFRFNLNEPLISSDYYKYLKLYFSKIMDINNNTFILLERKQQ
jgi:hypothetical protein